MHPGTALAELLKRKKCTIRELVNHLPSYDVCYLEDFVRGQRRCTRLLAEELAQALDTPIAPWLTLQYKYDKGAQQ